MEDKDEKKDEEQDRVKQDRMDHLEKGAEIGKSRERKDKNKKGE